MRNHHATDAASSTLTQVALAGITKLYGDRVVLDTVSLTVTPGEKCGIVGDNGSGKSTLLRLIAGRAEPDNGRLTVQAPGGMAYLAQSLEAPPTATVAEVIDVALADVRALEAELRAAEQSMAGATDTDLARYTDLITEFERRNGYEADHRVDVALHGLGLPGLDRDRPVSTLSGGEVSRLALAATLAAEPELLLLDEPTNNLDDAAVTWLADRLRAHRGTVLLVTHDRTFLDDVTSTIVEVDGDTHHVSRYGDGYRGYVRAKAAERARWEQDYADWLAETARQQRLAAVSAAHLATISRVVAHSNGGAGAARPRSTATGTSHKVRNANERLRRLQADPVPRPPEPLRFQGHLVAGSTACSPEPVVSLHDVAVAERLGPLDLELTEGGRLLVTGPNGAGKSTLLDVIAGVLEPDLGTVRRPAAIGYLRQEEPSRNPEETLLRAYAMGRPGLPEQYADELLATGLFRASMLTVPVGALSIGQRRRLGLARLLSHPLDLLLLDEPTNHLAPMLMDEVEEALREFTGALVIVSHDRRLRQTFTGTRQALVEGRLTDA